MAILASQSSDVGMRGEVLHLQWACGLSERQIAQSLQSSGPTVAEYVRPARVTSLSWPLYDSLDDALLEQRLSVATRPTPAPRCPMPDWQQGHRERRRKGVILFLLGQQEHCQAPVPNSGQGSGSAWHFQSPSHNEQGTLLNTIWMVERMVLARSLYCHRHQCYAGCGVGA